MKSHLRACVLCSALLLIQGWAPAAADGPATRQIASDGVDVQVDLGDAALRGGPDPLMSWIRRSLRIVTAYYGGFPTRTLRIRIVAEDGGGVRGGKTFGYRGGLIRVQVGRDVTDSQLLNDWVLVHEMTHLALPDVGEDHAWLSEGLAVYVEGIAREQAGNRTQQDVFAEEIRSMPRGLPQPGDRGLDHTHTWGRTYWGGAMFCLLADVEIHRRTGNRSGLQDAMRAVAKASGGLSADWPITRVFATADAATGTTVLADLYARMKDTPVSPDLPALWSKLGVEADGAAVHLNDTAPLADVRKAIMQARVNKTSS
ncbi:MAG: hypothetical protein ACREVV_03590 [Steroidobacteraceae bacterium]